MPKIGIYSRRGFFKMDDGIFKGLGISALLDSREKKDKAIALFGGRENIPTSIMRAKKARPTKESDDPVAGGRRYSETGRGGGRRKAWVCLMRHLK